MRRRTYGGEKLQVIQDGLILHLDGRDAPISNNWVSRVGDYKFAVSSITHSNNKYLFAGNGATLSNKAIDYSGANEITLEILDDGTLYSNTSLAIGFESSSNFFNNKGCYIVDFGEFVQHEIIFCLRAHSGYTGRRGATVNNDTTLYSIVFKANAFKIYKNAVLQSTSDYSSNPGTFGQFTNNTLYLGARNANTYYTKMGLHTLRCYARELTQDEILTNYNVDKVTFGF